MRTCHGSKPIERVLGILQVEMQALPGYAGRDARKNCPENVRKQIIAVRAGREHPAKYFLEKSAWMAALDSIF